MIDLEIVAHTTSLIFYLIALAIVIRFWRGIEDQRTWIGFPLGVLFFTIHQIFEFLSYFNNSDLSVTLDLLAQFSEVLGAASLAIAAYSLIRGLKRIQKIMDTETDVDEVKN